MNPYDVHLLCTRPSEVLTSIILRKREKEKKKRNRQSDDREYLKPLKQTTNFPHLLQAQSALALEFIPLFSCSTIELCLFKCSYGMTLVRPVALQHSDPGYPLFVQTGLPKIQDLNGKHRKCITWIAQWLVDFITNKNSCFDFTNKTELFMIYIP